MLALLGEGEHHGYEVIRTLRDRIGGDYSPSAGTVYPRLRQLEREGLVSAREEGGRVFYRLTAEGERARSELAAEIEELEAEVLKVAHGVATPLKAQVRRSAEELRQELHAQAKSLRSKDRSAPFSLELDQQLARLRREWARLAPGGMGNEQARSALAAAVDAAIRELKRLLETPPS
ncbi:MAG TPA: PadR family transcriptional regulator [Candidatus Dormibacteraeota bacterium]